MSSYIEQLKCHIDQCPSAVILRSDLNGICSDSYTSTLIKKLCVGGALIRVSHGVYVKARISRVTGEPVPAVRGGFSQLVRLVLTRLNIQYAESEAWYDYQTGRSTQVPANSVLYVHRNCTRQIAFGGMKANLIKIPKKQLRIIKKTRSKALGQLF